MCLITKENYRRTADENLTVYKILFTDNSARFKPDYVYMEGENTPADSSPLPKPDKDGYIKIEGGWLHAYVSRNKADDVVRCLASFSSQEIKDRTKVVEMVIPEGTDYFVSVQEDEVCAKKLVFYCVDEPVAEDNNNE